MAKQFEPKDRGTSHEQWNDLVYRYTEEERRRMAAGEDPSTIVREGRGRLEPLPLSVEGDQDLREPPLTVGDAVWNVKNILRRALRSVGEKISEGVTEAGRLTDLSRMGERQALPPVDSPPMFQPQGFPTVPPAEANREQRWKVEDKRWGDLLQ
jgi:hypothetical protein